MSDLNKYTPGPWEIRGGKFVNVELVAGSKMYVLQTSCEHHANVGFVCSWMDDSETLIEAQANANLIAAAPDLLTALQLAHDALAHCAADKGYQSLQNNAAHAAQRAIAKARGQS